MVSLKNSPKTMSTLLVDQVKNANLGDKVANDMHSAKLNLFYLAWRFNIGFNGIEWLNSGPSVKQFLIIVFFKVSNAR